MPEQSASVEKRKVGFKLGLGIFLLPLIFAWPLLRKGYSGMARFVGFSWLVLLFLLGATQEKSQPAQSEEKGSTSEVVRSEVKAASKANDSMGEIEFSALASKVNELAKEKDRITGKAERISPNESFLGEVFTAMVVPSVSGVSKATFYAKPGTSMIQFVKITFHGNGNSGPDTVSFISTAAAIIGAAAGTNQREVDPATTFLKEALVKSENGQWKANPIQSGGRIGNCEAMCVNYSGPIFFVVGIH